MRSSYQFAVAAILAFTATIAHADTGTAPVGAVARALLWQTKQYTYIRTIHFEASVRFTVTTVGGKGQVGNIRYEYWGAGSKYRIIFRQTTPQAKFDSVMADNGKHFYSLDRITGELVIRRSRPKAGDELMENPILEPLVPLAPPAPRHPAKWNLWVNLARFARNPKSIFGRCLAVRDCGKLGTTGEFDGCVTGSYVMVPARVKFTLRKGSWPHPLVTGWAANALGSSGMRTRLVRISYREFRLKSARVIFLPVAFQLDAKEPNYGPWKGPGTSQTKIRQIVLDKPIPLRRFMISYKLASFVTIVKHHKYTTMQVKPKGPPQGWSR